MATSKRAKEARQKKLAAEKKQRELAKKGISLVNKKTKKVFKDYEPKNDTFRPDCKEYRSLSSSECNTAKAERKEYTGQLVKGVMETHKSNLVPVVDPQHIIDITRMRRG